MRGEAVASLGVAGQVRDTAGRGCAGVLVSAVDTDGDQIARSRTGGDGTFLFPVPAPGAYLLVASSAEHYPDARYVTVGRGLQDQTVILTLDEASSDTGRRTGGGDERGRAVDEPAASPYARATVGLTAALLATRILTSPERHPALVASAARLVPTAPGQPGGGDAAAESAYVRARRAARLLLLPWARRLLEPLSGQGHDHLGGDPR
ncbi:MAG: carboxypeptidase-like regulatory domain-containing protein [Streptosporangiaceae bacterium]